ncbi:hypothetical protein ACQYRI_10145 [Salmonella enterica]
MSAGTLTLTNNSDVVTGSGTTFTTDLVAGDFVVAVVGGITYTLPVKSVESVTSLTLISNYPGATQTGVAWNAVPRATQNQITVALVAQTTEALRGLNYDKSNWQAVFSSSSDITVVLPDGSIYAGPSWNSISQQMSDLDTSISQQMSDLDTKIGNLFIVGIANVNTDGNVIAGRNITAIRTDVGKYTIQLSSQLGLPWGSDDFVVSITCRGGFDNEYGHVTSVSINGSGLFQATISTYQSTMGVGQTIAADVYFFVTVFAFRA